MSKFKFSFVATSRNDNHGGNMKIKNNYFVNSWINQVNQLKLSAELILIEWNPPEEEPRLKDEIKFKFKLHPGAQIKIITVPKEIHEQYDYSDKINLYQMIAKNVGIVRSEAEYIVCTNTDILFSQKLLNEINELALKNKNVVYRADRHDIDLDKFDNYEIDTENFFETKTVINTKYYSHDLIKNKKYYVNRSLKNYIINFYPTLKLIFFSNTPTENKMIINLRKLKFLFQNLFISIKNIFISIKDFLIKVKSRSIFSYDWMYIIFRTAPKKIFGFAIFIFYPFLFITQQIGASYKNIEFVNKTFKYMNNSLKNSFNIFLNFIRPFKEAFSILIEKKLNTNACGDFTMTSKENWIKIKGYWELDAYSWHIDSVAMWNFLYKKSKFKDLKNFTYHINHSIGSGYTPGSDELFKRLENKKIKYLTQSDLITSINVLHRTGEYNNDNWGLKDIKLETAIME